MRLNLEDAPVVYSPCSHGFHRARNWRSAPFENIILHIFSHVKGFLRKITENLSNFQDILGVLLSNSENLMNFSHFKISLLAFSLIGCYNCFIYVEQKCENGILAAQREKWRDCMNRTMLKQYTKLVEFLGLTLGPTYEITLHDVNGRNSSIVAICNGSISGRDLDSPPTTMALKAIEDNAEGKDYSVNYNGLTSGSRVLRSSTFYIKDANGNLVGMLCINFDDSKFQDVTRELFRLIHPDAYVDNKILIRKDVLDSEVSSENTERFNKSLLSTADAVVQEVLDEDDIATERLTQAEKIRIVARLEKEGVFRLKGAVEHVSKVMHSSPASIYRYLNKVREDKDS